MKSRKTVIMGLVLSLSVLGGASHAQEAVNPPFEAVEKYLDALEEQNTRPLLYGKLAGEEGEYRYVTFSSAATPEEAWVNIFESSAAWDSRSRRCSKRLVGKDTCPDGSKALFRSARPLVIDGFFGTVFSLGLKPFFGNMPWKVNFDKTAFDNARHDAESRLDVTEFRALVERYQAGWKEILAFEEKIQQAVSSRESQVSLALEGFDETDGITDDFFYDVVPRFSWRETPLTAVTLEALVAKVESTTEALRTLPASELVSLDLVCPGKRMRYLLKEVQCDVSAAWRGDDIVTTGAMSVERWQLPGVPVLEYDIGNDVLEAEFRNGLLAIRNISDSKVNIKRLDFMNAGKVWKHPLANNTVLPGKHIYYAELITNGIFNSALEDGKPISARKFLKDEQFGVRVLYSSSGGSTTTYLTEKMTLKDMLKSDISTLQENGAVLEDLELFKTGFQDMRSAAKQQRMRKALELLKERRLEGGGDA